MPGATGAPEQAVFTAPLWLPTSPREVRLTCAVFALLAAAGLAASFVLTPSATGHGTHTQLLLPPCMLYFLTGIPCPFCGMTTAFCHMARGEFAAAANSHVLGPLLYLATWAAGLACVVGVLTGRWPFPAAVTTSRFQRGLLVTILLAWGVQLWRYLS